MSNVIGVRAKQKEKTRQALIEAAFSQLSAERSFTSLSLREVAREAGSPRPLFIAISKMWMNWG